MNWEENLNQTDSPQPTHSRIIIPAAAARKKEIPIVFCADKNYGKYIAVTIQSIITHASPDVIYRIFVFDCGIERRIIDVVKKWVERQANFKIEVYDINPFLKRYQEAFIGRDMYTPSVFGRFAIPEFCGYFDKVLYVDCDIIFRCDPAILLNQDIGSSYIGAVIDHYFECERILNEGTRAYFQEKLNLTERDIYVNAGLMLLNVEAWKRDSIVEKCIQKLTEKGRLKFLDQDAINSVCKGNIFYFPVEYNTTLGNIGYVRYRKNDITARGIRNISILKDYYLGEYEYKAQVIHYTGLPKPWADFNVILGNIWWEEARSTPLFAEYISEMVDLKFSNENYLYDRRENYYTVFGLPIWWVKQAKSGKRYGIGSLRLAKTKQGKQNTYLYILGIKCASIRRK